MRVILHHAFGKTAYVGFGSNDPLTGQARLPHIAGHAEFSPMLADTLKRANRENWHRLEPFLEKMEREEQIHFIKTHLTPDKLFDTGCRCILIVRDARDAFISMAHHQLLVVNTWSRFWYLFKSARGVRRLTICQRVPSILKLRMLILFGWQDRILGRSIRQYVRSSHWSDFYRKWTGRAEGRTTIVRFEDLIARPLETTVSALRDLEVPLVPSGGEIPKFEKLHRAYPQFFRSGRVGQWSDLFPPWVNDSFWEYHGEMMRQLGYSKQRSVR